MAGSAEICQIAEVLTDTRLQSGSVRITGRCGGFSQSPHSRLGAAHDSRGESARLTRRLLVHGQTGRVRRAARTGARVVPGREHGGGDAADGHRRPPAARWLHVSVPGRDLPGLERALDAGPWGVIAGVRGWTDGALLRRTGGRRCGWSRAWPATSTGWTSTCSWTRWRCGGNSSPRGRQRPDSRCTAEAPPTAQSYHEAAERIDRPTPLTATADRRRHRRRRLLLPPRQSCQRWSGWLAPRPPAKRAQSQQHVQRPASWSQPATQRSLAAL